MLSRYWHTLRHLSRRQWFWRLRYTVARKTGIYARPALPAVAPRFNRVALERLKSHAQCRAQVQGMACLEAAAEFRRGNFTFLHKTLTGGSTLPWQDLSRGRLWLYHLHYFDYARVLAEASLLTPSAADGAQVLGWIHDWIEKNPVGTDVAWDAFCVSSRLMNWAVAEAVVQWDDELMRRSFEQQVNWLLRHIEWDIRATHLLKNAAALTVASQLIGGKSILPGRELLEAEVAEQVLPDGGHIERSPMYHGLVLEDLLLVCAALSERPVALLDAVARMTRWGEVMRHPDGALPLFADSAMGECLPPAQVVALAAKCGVTWESASGGAMALSESGYYVAEWPGRTATSRVIVKTCGPEPAYQPGHAHADPFTYEYSVSGQRMVVDTGVHGYAESPWRAYCRSVAAHNCAKVNDGEPMDAWGVFRVGRRYVPRVESWTVDRLGNVHLAGKHDGYPGYTVSREMRMVRECGIQVCDSMQGARGARLRSYVHLAPGAEVREEKGLWCVERAGAVLWLVPAAGTLARYEAPRAEPPQGWHFSAFGKGEPAGWFELEPATGEAHELGYALVEADSAAGARSVALKMEPDV